MSQSAAQAVLADNGYTSGMDESVANVFTADDYVTLAAVSLFSNQAEGSTAEIAVYLGGESGKPKAEHWFQTDCNG